MDSYKVYNITEPSAQPELLRTLVGQRVVEMVRYLDWSPEESAAVYGLDLSALFRFVVGVLEISFESGLRVGFDSNPSTASLEVWLVQSETGGDIGQVVEVQAGRLEEMLPIHASDERYADPAIRALLGQEIQALTILQRKFDRIRVPKGEVALSIRFTDGQTLLLAHGLHDDSDSFALILPEEILSSIADQLEPIFQF